jgi:hypothetical protein
MKSTITINQIRSVLEQKHITAVNHLDNLKTLESAYSSPEAFNASYGYWQGYRDGVRSLQTYLVDIRQGIETPVVTHKG